MSTHKEMIEQSNILPIGTKIRMPQFDCLGNDQTKYTIAKFATIIGINLDKDYGLSYYYRYDNEYGSSDMDNTRVGDIVNKFS